PAHSETANYWFSFGDSYSDTGFAANNTASATGVTQPILWTSHADPGLCKKWVNYVTTTYNASLVFTYNYAYRGATLDATLVQPFTPTARNLLQYRHGKCSEPLFSVWIGPGGISAIDARCRGLTRFSDIVLNTYFASVQKLVRLTQYLVNFINFLFINVPPFHRTPRSASSHSPQQAIIAGYNRKLSAKVTAFKENNEGVSTLLYDVYTKFTAILDDPTAYGLKGSHLWTFFSDTMLENKLLVSLFTDAMHRRLTIVFLWLNPAS
ncbi:hypothetical protein L208DRAFT_1317048, partial [Tricholoma matsutake]